MEARITDLPNYSLQNALTKSERELATNSGRNALKLAGPLRDYITRQMEYGCIRYPEEVQLLNAIERLERKIEGEER